LNVIIKIPTHGMRKKVSNVVFFILKLTSYLCRFHQVFPTICFAFPVFHTTVLQVYLTLRFICLVVKGHTMPLK
jgi:hypothetical protein